MTCIQMSIIIPESSIQKVTAERNINMTVDNITANIRDPKLSEQISDDDEKLRD